MEAPSIHPIINACEKLRAVDSKVGSYLGHLERVASRKAKISSGGIDVSPQKEQKRKAKLERFEAIFKNSLSEMVTALDDVKLNHKDISLLDKGVTSISKNIERMSILICGRLPQDNQKITNTYDQFRSKAVSNVCNEAITHYITDLRGRYERDNQFGEEYFARLAVLLPLIEACFHPSNEQRANLIKLVNVELESLKRFVVREDSEWNEEEQDFIPIPNNETQSSAKLAEAVKHCIENNRSERSPIQQKFFIFLSHNYGGWYKEFLKIAEGMASWQNRKQATDDSSENSDSSDSSDSSVTTFRPIP